MYTKQTWKTGDVITEDKLNHMEDGISTGGGIYTYSETVLFDGEVETTADEMSDDEIAFGQFTPSSALPSIDLGVEFNGQKYTLPYVSNDFGGYWGEAINDLPSFENYPLYISYDNVENLYYLTTPGPGTYTLRIYSENLSVSTKMKKQVAEVSNLVVNVKSDDGVTFVLDKTWEEIFEAVESGKNIIIRQNERNMLYLACYENGYSVDVINIYINDEAPAFEYWQFIASSADGYPSYTE